MNKILHYLLVTHPAGGWFRGETSGKRKKKEDSTKFFLTPESHNSRNGATKREPPRFNPAP